MLRVLEASEPLAVRGWNQFMEDLVMEGILWMPSLGPSSRHPKIDQKGLENVTNMIV